VTAETKEVRQDGVYGQAARRVTEWQHPGWKIIATRRIDPTQPSRGVVHTITPEKS